jgi:hybrid polyketide synthase/nonribosomal peptide synthetase ACE1
MRLRDNELNNRGLGNRKGSAASVQARLASVKSQEEASNVVQNAFLARLRSILIMPKTEVIDPLTSLVKLGADSIMAVDIWAWFPKELTFDIPVLKILGPGVTVADLVAVSVAKLVLDLDPTKLGDEKEENDVHAKPVASSQANAELQLANYSTSNSGRSETSSRTSPSLSSLTTALGTPLEPSAEVAARRLEQQGKEDEWKLRRTTIVNSVSEQIEPMTLGQKRFWFLSHYVQDPTTFNITYFAKIQGHIRVNDLARAVDIVAQRHESLRTRFF